MLMTTFPLRKEGRKERTKKKKGGSKDKQKRIRR
jgi:hypothetical protein